VAKVIWACFKEALGWDRSAGSIQDVFKNWIPLECKDYHIKLFMFSGILWGLWHVRNEMGIEL
jgi:hypothetical protein